MPFPFAYVCDLLEKLSTLNTHHPPLLPKVLDYSTSEATLKWLRGYRHLLDAATTDDNAVIKMFQPEKETGRMIDAENLEQVIARVLNLPKKGLASLRRWRQEHIAGDLAACVERVMENMAATGQRVTIRAEAIAVTVEHIDQSLLLIASHNKGYTSDVSSPALAGIHCETIQILGNIFRRLTPRDAKWLTRLILKDFGPVKFPENLICKSNLSFLPHCIQVSAQLSSSIPPKFRRDGPGLLRLKEAASDGGLTFTQPVTAAPAHSTRKSDSPPSGLTRLPCTKDNRLASMARSGTNSGGPIFLSQSTELRLIRHISIGEMENAN